MVQLFLEKPVWDDEGNDAVSGINIPSLTKLESFIRSLIISSGNRSEARVWLCSTISSICQIPKSIQCQIFTTLLKSSSNKRSISSQLMQLIFEKKPHSAGRVLANKSSMLEDFFKGHPRRILQWFSPSLIGGNHPSAGAKSLSQFAFVNRDICWEELVWKGKHGQSPAMVATKPHYFNDIDIERTVANFVEYVPEFWSSKEFSRSLASGEIFSLDIKYFVNLFVDLLCKEDSRAVWEVVSVFLTEESFYSLCDRLLIILEEQDMLFFLKLIQKHVHYGINSIEFNRPSSWLEFVLSECDDWESMDELLLANAVINQGRQLIRIIHEDDEEKEDIEGTVTQICSTSDNSDTLAPIMRECFHMKSIKAIKQLGIRSWALHFVLSKYSISEQWETLFVNNGINFRRSGEYNTLLDGSASGDSGFDSDGKLSYKFRRKDHNSRKKRRRFDCDEGYCGEFDNQSISDGLRSSAGSWFLSTDGYATLWDSMDLPEYIARYGFSTWLKWIASDS